MRTFSTTIASLLLWMLVITTIYTGLLVHQFGQNILPYEKHLSFDKDHQTTSTTDLQAAESRVTEKVLPSVVTILGMPPSSTKSTKASLGTGFFVESNGYILTNKHVVQDTAADYIVLLKDGQRKNADVVYRDPKLDLAVIKIPGYNYPTLKLADTNRLSMQQPVVAVGNSYTRQDEVESGAISGFYNSTFGEPYEKVTANTPIVIESNIGLIPGDSGGPLVDMNGNVVGVNFATSVFETASFSIAANFAKPVVEKAEQLAYMQQYERIGV